MTLFLPDHQKLVTGKNYASNGRFRARFPGLYMVTDGKMHKHPKAKKSSRSRRIRHLIAYRYFLNVKAFGRLGKIMKKNNHLLIIPNLFQRLIYFLNNWIFKLLSFTHMQSFCLEMAVYISLRSQMNSSRYLVLNASNGVIRIAV